MAFDPNEHEEFSKWFLDNEDVLCKETLANKTGNVAQGDQPGKPDVDSHADQGAAVVHPGQGSDGGHCAAGGQPGQGEDGGLPV